MKKDEIAVYLNEHPEFFNDYPELLKQIKEIDENDLPIEPFNTLSVADRIIKRANADKEHMRSKLEWFLEIVEANEQIQEHLFEIEREVLSSSNLPEMIRSLTKEIQGRFDLKHVQIGLVDGADHFIEDKIQERFLNEAMENLVYLEQDTASAWLKNGMTPVLRGEIDTLANRNGPDFPEEVKSEALIPIILRGKVAGILALGSFNPLHFYEGLRTDFLERLGDKLALSIDNLLLLDIMERQVLMDHETGIFNESYLEPILLREFDRAQRYGKKLSCLKIHIDYLNDFEDTLNLDGKDPYSPRIGTLLKECCRTSDILIRSGEHEYFVLLPEISERSALVVAERIRKDSKGELSNGSGENHSYQLKLGVATFPGKNIDSHHDLLDSVHDNLNKFKTPLENRALVG